MGFFIVFIQVFNVLSLWIVNSDLWRSERRDRGYRVISFDFLWWSKEGPWLCFLDNCFDHHVFRVDAEVCIVLACLCLWRCLLLVPTLLLRSDILSIWWNIDTPFLFFDVLQLFRLCTPLVLLGVQAEALCSFLHMFQFQYMVSAALRGIRCGLSIFVENDTNCIFQL